MRVLPLEWNRNDLIALPVQIVRHELDKPLGRGVYGGDRNHNGVAPSLGAAPAQTQVTVPARRETLRGIRRGAA